MTTLVAGAYTADMGGKADGLTVFPGGKAGTPSPSFVIAGGSVLYAVNEGAGTVSSFALDVAGAPQPLSAQSTGGKFPCHLALHESHLIVANYGSGDVSVHPVGDGVIGRRSDLVRHRGSGPHPGRQEGPHPHQVTIDADGVVTVVDLGIDRLVHYRLAEGRLDRVGETVLPPGTGPRHYAVDPVSGRRYVVAELASAVLTLAASAGWPGGAGASGASRGPGDGLVLATTPATAAGGENLPSGIALGGDHLYVANRGADTIATFRLGADGTPQPVAETPCGGSWPRDLTLTAEGLVVANERSHNLAFFRLDGGVPILSQSLETPSPTCVLPL